MFDKLKFMKGGVETSWNDSQSFPTIETSESVVRSDMQLFHDQTKAALNDLIDDLSESGASAIGATPVGDGTATTVQGVLEELNTKIGTVAPTPYHRGSTAPTNTALLWIDTTATTGGLKYYNGTAWVSVPVSYT